MIDVSTKSGARSAIAGAAAAGSHDERVSELLSFASDAGAEALLDAMADFVGAAVEAGHVELQGSKGEA